MNTQQINTLIKSDCAAKQIFAGTYPSDKLPPPVKIPFCIVANLDESYKKGSHWIALYINEDWHGEYFDSFGQQPKKALKEYLDRHCIHWKANRQRIQGVLASTCGHYCIFMVLMWSRGQSMQASIKRFDPVNRANNDIVITEFINKNFDCSFPTYDLNYIANQISATQP